MIRLTAVLNLSPTTGRLTDDHQEIPKMMSAVDHFSRDIRSRMEEQAEAERATLEQTLNRLALDVTAFRRALSTRKKLQLAYTVKENRVKQVKKQMDAAGNDDQKKKDVDKKQSAGLHELENASRFLKVKLEECSDRILEESDRVRPDLEARLSGGLKGCAHVQMEFGDKIRDIWAEIMPTFEKEGPGNGDDAGAMPTTIAISKSGESGAIAEPGESAPEHPPPSAPVPEAPSQPVTEEG